MSVAQSQKPAKPRIWEAWEVVSLTEAGQTSIEVSRMQVPGGWIYKTEVAYSGISRSSVRTSICFVPRPAEEQTGQ